jgi:hypothetical protein
MGLDWNSFILCIWDFSTFFLRFVHINIIFIFIIFSSLYIYIYVYIYIYSCMYFLFILEYDVKFTVFLTVTNLISFFTRICKN